MQRSTGPMQLGAIIVTIHMLASMPFHWKAQCLTSHPLKSIFVAKNGGGLKYVRPKLGSACLCVCIKEDQCDTWLSKCIVVFRQITLLLSVIFHLLIPYCISRLAVIDMKCGRRNCKQNTTRNFSIEKNLRRTTTAASESGRLFWTGTKICTGS